MLRFAIAVMLIAACGTAPAARAQRVSVQAEGLHYHEYGEGVTLFTGLRTSSATHQGPGFDFWLGVWPEAIADGALVAFSDLDFAYAVPLLERLEVVPRAGVSAIAVGGGGFGGVAGGWNAGIGVVGRLRPNLGIRGDYTFREISPGEYPARFSSVSLGLFWDMARRGSRPADGPGSGRLAAPSAALDSTGVGARGGKGDARILVAVLAVFGGFTAWVLNN